MSSNIQPNQLLFRDGVSQQNRYSDSLNPGNIAVEDRSYEQLIIEAQRLATEIRFFDEQNKAMGNWEAFLVDDVERYKNESPTQQQIIREQWAQQLAAYVEAPERFQNDAAKLTQLSRPHVVLFMTFLQLLNHIKAQINGLTKKHLDFYFLERLGLTPKNAVPDVVNVLVQLVEDIDQLEIKAGTTLLAGKDSAGNELHYTTDYDTVISQAAIAQLKTVFVEKSTLTIADAHANNVNDADKGFTKMMEMALGDPNPADTLPALPPGVNNLVALSEGLDSDVQKQRYVTEQLFLTIEDFNFVIQVHLSDLDATKSVTAAEWQEVYTILDKAYKNKVSKKQQLALKEIREGNTVNGFNEMIRHVYGSPDAGDDLPPYRGAEASLTIVYNDLLSDPGSGKQDAAGYLSNELFLTEKNFVRLIQVSEDAGAQATDWDEIYEMLELAERKVRSRPLSSPFKEELINVYAEPNAAATAFSLSGEKEESLRYKTFGGYSVGTNQPLSPATIGFAISSPVLLLEEGKRQITCFIALDPQSEAMNDVEALFSASSQNGFPPFQVYLTTEEAWTQPVNTVITFGDYVVAEPESAYKATISQDTVTITAGDDFTQGDVEKYLVFTNGNMYKITGIDTPKQVKVQQVGKTGSPEQIQKYNAGAVYLHTLRVVIELSETDGPVVAPVSAASNGFTGSGFPAMTLALNHAQATDGQHYYSRYQQLIGLKIEKIYLKATVQGLRNLTLQNNETTIDAKKPFEPFGAEPETGTGFYLANKELAQKRLDSLQLDLQWMKAPASFSDHYKNYWLIQSGNPDLPASGYTIKGNEDFKARVFLCDRGAEFALPDIALFSGAATIDNIPGLLQSAAYQYQGNVYTHTDEEDVLNWDRYLRLELSGVDFQHGIYNMLLGKQAISGNANIKELLLNPPYTPRLKKLSVGYSAHTEFYPGKPVASTNPEKLYHIHPFGFAPLNGESNLLPDYTDEGTLYLGINRLIKPQTLSILFQLAEGSADPDIDKPVLQWSYLKDDQWIPFSQSDMISDTTNDLLNTGIIQLNIPTDATGNNTLMPGGLHWIKVSCDRNSTAISDTIQIMAQGLSATFAGEEVAPDHFVDLLAAGSITETLEPNPKIRQIEQPYTSGKGKPAEKDTAFYNRISERLRHKNRAITMWDYERMVLDRFPEVYKVKCLPALEPTDALRGRVNVMVIPDIRGKLPFNPFQPKVAADTLAQIQQHLEMVAPAYADISVKNPGYLQIKIRCVVKFKPGYNEGFYKARLIDELKRFLSPWAYGENNNVTIGGTIYASVIINFIAERPYIDFVANMKLFQSEDGKQFTDVRMLNDGKNQVVAYQPDMVLVSATSHEIDVVDENGYDEDNYEGINYMKVELDFQVGEDLIAH